MPILKNRGDNRLNDVMKLDKKQFSSGIVGAIIGASSVAGINALDSATHKSKAQMYERVELSLWVLRLIPRYSKTSSTSMPSSSRR